MAAREISIEDLNGLGEDQTLEFKQSAQLRKEAFQSLCAMVNADAARGTVVFGVAPDGTVVGLGDDNIDSTQRTLVQHARQKFDPPINVELEAAVCNGASILLMRAVRDRGVQYHEYDGRAYMRQGATNSVPSMEQKQRLAKSRNRDLHQVGWRCDKCGAVVGTLNANIITAGVGVVRRYGCRCGGEYWPA